MNNNRRNFIKTATLGLFGLFAGFSAGRLMNKPARTGGPLEWSILENGERIKYTFHKGPKYTTLEDAFQHMQKIVKSMHENAAFSDDVVILESMTYVGKIA